MASPSCQTDDQMEQSSTQTTTTTTTATAPNTLPTDSDHTSVPLPEPPSTRPNPFDDSDLSARKRRRTSGSPSASPPTLSASTSEFADNADKDFDHQRSATMMNTEQDFGAALQLPHTPTDEIGCSSTPLSPSKVTLSLRRASRHAANPRSESPALGHQVPLNDKSPPEDMHKFTGSQARATPNVETPKLSDSASPPVQLIAISDNEADDDDMVFSVGDGIEGDLGRGPLSLDPMSQFPYTELGEEPMAPLQRFINYLASEPLLDCKLIALLQAWIKEYLVFAKTAEASLVTEDRAMHKTFWTAFPAITFHLSMKSSELFKSLETRNVLISYYSSFASLSVCMVHLDLEAIRIWQLQAARDRQDLELFSARYLQQLHEILSSDPCLVNMSAAVSAPGWPRNDAGLYLVRKLQTGPGSVVQHLIDLASLLAGLVPEMPKMVDNIAPVAQIIADCFHEAARTVIGDFGHERKMRAAQHLEMGHNLWNTISECLELMLEKYVTQLASDVAVILLQALTEMLKFTLRGSNQQTCDKIQLHLQQFPRVPAFQRIEAIVWQWRIGILEKMIRSSQMQLRVMAISKLCTDLVSIWKTAADGGIEGSVAFLEHIGDLVLQTGLIEYIFGPNCHPEIIVESSNILGFLIVVKMYKREHTDRIWQGLTFNQNPRVAEALARMVSQITNLFDYDGLMGWCEKFESLPLEGFSPSMRSLWDSIMSDIILRSQSERQGVSIHPYALCLRLLREACLRKSGLLIADADLQLAAMQRLKNLLLLGPDPEDRKNLFQSCVDDIAEKSPTTLGSLWFLYIATKSAGSREIQQLTELHDVARIVIEELAHASQSDHGADPTPILSGSPNLPRRELITCIIQLQPTVVDNDLGKQLLDILIGPRSPCAEDRKAGWFVVMNVMQRSSLKNHFLQTCFSGYLPSLPASCFSEGMLEFIRERVLSLAGDDIECALDDPQSQCQTGIEQLWRIILEAEDSDLVSQAISTLGIDLFLEGAIGSYSPARCKKLHVSLVTRCSTQMKQAAAVLHGSGDSDDATAPDNDQRRASPAKSTEYSHKLMLVFKRSLQLLRFFLERHQAHPRHFLADLRTLMPKSPEPTRGISAELKYQAFNDNEATEIRPLRVGIHNTAASLLAQLRQETAFENFRLYYRGRSLFLTEHLASQSLEELGICDHIVLVRREESPPLVAAHVKPGSSQLEVEILSQFQDLWEYLSMETLAEEIYDFFVQLPAHWRFTQQFASEKIQHTDVFLKGHPFKTLYAIHAIRDYVATVRPKQSISSDPADETGSVNLFHQALKRTLRLVVDAIGDPEILDGLTLDLQLRVASSLLQIFVELFDEAAGSESSFQFLEEMIPNATRLADMLSLADGDVTGKSLALIDRTIAAIFTVASSSIEFWHSIATDTRLLESVVAFVLRDPRKRVRHAICGLIDEAISPRNQCKTLESDELATSGQRNRNAITSSLCSAFMNDLPRLLDHCSHPEEYFFVLRNLIERSYATKKSSIDTEALAAVALDLLLEHTSTESIDIPDVTDSVAAGLVSLLYFCLQADESLVTTDKFDDHTVIRLFWRHLFPRKRRGQVDSVPKVIFNSSTRRRLYEIIFRLVKSRFTSFLNIVDTLNGLVPFFNDQPDDPYRYDLPFQFDRSRAVRAPCGYVGLRNLSNTCYLNSLLTQLFMNIPFRTFILSVSVKDPEESQQLLFYTQKLFAYMQESYQRFVDPVAVVTSIKTYDDTLIDIHSQMDVDEFYNLLFDRWEGQLIDGEDKKQLRSFFGGQLVQQVKSMECQHISERLEPFSAIQCDIKGKNTLQDSLQAYVDGEVMEGENKYKCSTCDRHVDAVKRACLKDLPDNLIFHLKRFDFNVRTLQRSKINDYFSFPLSLDMSPYTVESLNGQAGSAQSDVFQLVGILVHSGTAESGHYYSYIRERGTFNSSRWIEFNDDAVNPWDPLMMESSTYGGPDQHSIHETNGILYDKSYSAYMLFYQRSSCLEVKTSVDTAESSSRPISSEMSTPLKEHIMEENKFLVRRHCLFDPSHSFFVQQCFGHAVALGETQLVTPQGTNGHADGEDAKYSFTNLTRLAMELAVSHFDQVVTRTKDMPFLNSFSSLLRTAIVKSSDCAFAFYCYFSIRQSSLRSLLQRNQDPEARAFSGRIFVLAVERVRNSLSGQQHTRAVMSVAASRECDEIDDDWEQESDASRSVVRGAVDIFNYLWKFFYVHIKSWDEYFTTVLEFAKLGECEAGHVLSEDFLHRLLRIITADPMEQLPSNYQRMLMNLMRRFQAKPASYAAVLALIDYLMSQLEPVLGPEVICDEAKERVWSRRPFFWTSDEVQAVTYHPQRHPTSFFVEKLLDIDQAPDVSQSIIGRLVESGEELDVRVFNTLQIKIQGDTPSQSMDAALRAVVKYAECSQSIERIQHLIHHVCTQASGFQLREGSTFLALMQSVLQARSSDAVMDQAKRHHALQTIPSWAPFLLAYGDEQTRLSAEFLVCGSLFEPWTAASATEQNDDAVPERELLQKVIRQLGIKCLLYLRNYHVVRRSPLERGAAATISKMINKCTPFYDSGEEMTGTDHESMEFAAIQGEIRSPLQQLVVDELESDASEWEGSCASSDLMDMNPLGNACADK